MGPTPLGTPKNKEVVKEERPHCQDAADVSVIVDFGPWFVGDKSP